jgi:hypothetical protein
MRTRPASILIVDDEGFLGARPVEREGMEALES